MSSPMAPLLPFLKLAPFLQNLLLTIPKKIMLLFFRTIGVPLENNSSAITDEFLSPFLVPLPIEFTFESLKADHTLLLKYGEYLRRVGRQRQEEEEEEEICVVCLACLKEEDTVRQIRSCCHVFHAECVDAWFHGGHATCPLCRFDLSLRQHLEKSQWEGDPWRRERMIYLFGDDNITFWWKKMLYVWCGNSDIPLEEHLHCLCRPVDPFLLTVSVNVRNKMTHGQHEYWDGWPAGKFTRWEDGHIDPRSTDLTSFERSMIVW